MARLYAAAVICMILAGLPGCGVIVFEEPVIKGSFKAPPARARVEKAGVDALTDERPPFMDRSTAERSYTARYDDGAGLLRPFKFEDGKAQSRKEEAEGSWAVFRAWVKTGMRLYPWSGG